MASSVWLLVKFALIPVFIVALLSAAVLWRGPLRRLRSSDSFGELFNSLFWSALVLVVTLVVGMVILALTAGSLKESTGFASAVFSIALALGQDLLQLFDPTGHSYTNEARSFYPTATAKAALPVAVAALAALPVFCGALTVLGKGVVHTREGNGFGRALVVTLLVLAPALAVVSWAGHQLFIR